MRMCIPGKEKAYLYKEYNGTDGVFGAVRLSADAGRVKRNAVKQTKSSGWS